jgi:molecular chaperone DnaJ
MRSANAASAWPDERSNSPRDYYEVLGLARTADADAIRQAYRRLARELHPDVSDSPEAEERFRELTAAYTVLSEPAARLLYDQFGYRGRGNGFSTDGRRSSQTPVLAEVNVDVFEAARGTRRQVRYASREQCQACNGKGYAPGAKKPECETCSGKGRLTRSASLGIGDWLQVEKCPDCKGAGFAEEHLCPDCGGAGSLSREQVVKVRLPAGVEDGTRLRVVGNPEDEHLLVQVRPLPADSHLVLVLAAALLACSVALLVYFLLAH